MLVVHNMPKPTISGEIANKMSRLPTPGGDDGTWGIVLNDFLNVAHAADGTLNSGIVTNANIADGTIALGKLATSVQTSLGKADTALQSVTKSDVGLGNVDNTSDANKPVSVAMQNSLNAKLDSSSLDSSTAALVSGSSSTSTAITSKINSAIGGSNAIYILAPADPDPTTGSPAGLYFRRTS